MSTWGSIIREARQTKGLTQTELADALGVDQSTIARWEKGDYLINDKVAQLFEVLEIPWATLDGDGCRS